MLKKLLITIILTTNFYSQFSYAVTDEELLIQDCEQGVPDALTIGSIEYQQAIDECVNSEASTTPAQQDQGDYIPSDNE